MPKVFAAPAFADASGEPGGHEGAGLVPGEGAEAVPGPAPVCTALSSAAHRASLGRRVLGLPAAQSHPRGLHKSLTCLVYLRWGDKP